MIGERIKEVREKNGFTQSSLAKKLGLSRSAVNAWEMGVSIPSAQYLIELAKLFKVSTDYILEVEPQETLNITSLENEEKQILYSLINYFEKHRKAVDIIEQSRYCRIEREYNIIKESGMELPDYVEKIFNRILDL